MTTHNLVAPPVGTIYRLSHVRWYKRLREDEYWQVERRTDKTVWMRKLVTDTDGKPMRVCVFTRACTRTCTTTSTSPDSRNKTHKPR